jgi:hypothetical protein
MIKELLISIVVVIITIMSFISMNHLTGLYNVPSEHESFVDSTLPVDLLENTSSIQEEIQKEEEPVEDIETLDDLMHHHLDSSFLEVELLEFE